MVRLPYETWKQPPSVWPSSAEVQICSDLLRDFGERYISGIGVGGSASVSVDGLGRTRGPLVPNDYCPVIFTFVLVCVEIERPEVLAGP